MGDLSPPQRQSGQVERATASAGGRSDRLTGGDRRSYTRNPLEYENSSAWNGARNAGEKRRPLATLTENLADRLKTLRLARGWSLDAMAAATGISRATLSRLERADTSPTAEMLGRIGAAFGQSVSALIGAAEASPAPLIRTGDRLVWRDPETGFERQIVSPKAVGIPHEVVEGRLPAGAAIAYPAPPVPGQAHCLIMLSGLLTVTLDGVAHRLEPGDCLRYRLNGASDFTATGEEPARYLLILS